MPSLILLLTACTFGVVTPPDLLDTGDAPVQAEAAVETEPGTARLTVAPQQLDETGLCDATAPLWVANDGETDLTANLIAHGDLTVSAEQLQLAPGEAVEVWVSGTSGLVQIESDAGIETVEVSLEQLASPTLETIAAHYEVIEGPTVLEVLANAEPGTRVQWTSDRDGLIGDTPVVDGWATLEWTPMALGDHNITATLIDACGQETSAVQAVCHDGAIVQEGFEGWEIEGNAWLADDELTLTDDAPWQLGAAWLPMDIPGDAVEVAFSFYASSASLLSADGLALVVADAQRWDGSLGPGGGGMGFGAGVEPGAALPGWALELDTSYNLEVDPTRDDHTAFVVDGDLASWRASSPLPELEDGAWHRAELSLQREHLVVAVDGDTVIDTYIHDDLDYRGVLGFTAATGSITSNHRVADVQVVTRACD